MPENAMYVGRPTIFGNPFETAEEFLQWMEDPKCGITEHDAIMANLHRLRGKDLVCWCPLNRPCHADVLIEFVNK